MGVPKFFRYMSERYPCLSEVIKDYQVPEFDNLYLDMNGIIHNCSHPDDNVHFRITEEKIFQDIFHYIECLFRMIKPQKVFFMAVDGVAPRAKMNQQRGRRFRSAKDAERSEARARERGETLPEEARFDSNCITPGTVFMARLQEQLKFFVVDKISNDPLWQKCKIILSGHETPGEGEHKIMDYIRYIRAQPGYDPNTRHCLYGLDADLMMLGLCTHEKHFSLLREEVKFGKKDSSKRDSVPEQITFFLLHLSLMREYLEMEFYPLKENLTFEYDLEQIIDDWVLMGFLVGNDFIPHLPNLHIANGALPLIYKAYMKVLPTLGGYINENGILNLPRFEKFLAALSEIDLDYFQETYADLKYFEAKTGRRPNETSRTSYKTKQLEAWQPEDSNLFSALEAPQKKMSSDLQALIKATEDMFLEPSEKNLKELEDDEDGVEEGGDSESTDDDYEDMNEDDLFQEEFKIHKRHYYMNKLKYEQVTPEVLKSQAEGYIRAIQWNLHYYYNGVCSWSWYYPHHYAPFITDIKGFSDLSLKFEMGEPFQPYEQLLAVLPSASKDLLPTPYHELMTQKESMIQSYYPKDFEMDLNGKKNDWEALVLIPFIDEEVLLRAMRPCNELLTPEEKKRNTHGPMLIYQYTEDDLGEYPAPEYFPPVKSCRAICTPVSIKDIRVPQDELVKGAYPGVKMDTFYPGFSTFKHLKCTGHLEKSKVRVFDQPSRYENMIVTLLSEPELPPTGQIAEGLLGRQIFVSWPHLVEALVVEVSDESFRYTLSDTDRSVHQEANASSKKFELDNSAMADYYKTRLGVQLGEVNVLVYVKTMTGRKYTYLPGEGRVTLEKQWLEDVVAFPYQTIVKDIKVYEKNYKMYRDLTDVYPDGTKCFYLGHPGYGSFSEVVASEDSAKKGRVKIVMDTFSAEPNFQSVFEFERKIRTEYMSLHTAASKLSMSRKLFTRITGSIFVHQASNPNEDSARVDLGLNLKHNKKNKEIPGYTKRHNQYWYYSNKVLELINDYVKFCPEIFDYLSQNVNNDMFYEEDMFPGEDRKEKIKEILAWKKKQHYSSVGTQSCDTLMAEEAVVKKIEETVDAFYENNVVKKITLQVKPDMLYKSSLVFGNIQPDPKAKFQLYDRVVNVRESYTVPLGLSGTVIGIHKALPDNETELLYDVVFDQQFTGGLQLGCSPNRGYTLPAASLINRSHGLREMEIKTGRRGQLIQSVQNQQQPQAHQRQHHSPQNSYYQQPNSAFASWNNNQRANISNSQNFVADKTNYHIPLAYQQRMQKQKAQSEPKTYSKAPPPGVNWQENKNDFTPIFKSNDNSPIHQKRTPNKHQHQKTGRGQQQKVSPQVSGGASPAQRKPEEFKQYTILKQDKPQKQQQQKKSSSAEGEDPLKNQSISAGPNAITPSLPQVFDTDSLKRMLKIGEDEAKPEGNPTTAQAGGGEPLKEEETKIDLQEIFAHAKAQKQQHLQQKQHAMGTAQQPKATVQATAQPKKSQQDPLAKSYFYSMKLLVIYQGQGLGCPIYQYFPLPNGQYQAQVRTPNGRSLFGKVADSKEQACENVAEALLRIMAPSLKKDSSPKSSAPTNSFPTPPQQWCTSEVAQKQARKSPVKPTQQYYTPPKGKAQDQPEAKTTPPNKNAALMFIPPQAEAVMHTNKAAGNVSNKDASESKENSQTHTNSAASESTLKTNVAVSAHNNSNAQRHKKMRKCRIAANFNVPPPS